MPLMSEKVDLKPVLDGEWRMIGDNPDLGDIQGSTTDPPNVGKAQECVDHHVFQAADGTWHLWGCIRQTKVGRVLYHWEAENITDEHWRQTGEYFRVDRDVGESLGERNDEEFIQSPFVIREGDLYYMFYGGHCAGTDVFGNVLEPGDERMAGQMCLMTSPDGRNWTRHRDHNGQSRVFIGPGGTRDPVLIKIGGIWHMYYAGYYGEKLWNPGFFVRASDDLIHWSDWKLVHADLRYGKKSFDTECPHVAERGGHYYLFRTEDYYSRKTHVFRSEDLYDFGIGDATGHYVCSIEVAAPEIIVDDQGREWITSNHDLTGGTCICPLKWAGE